MYKIFSFFISIFYLKTCFAQSPIVIPVLPQEDTQKQENKAQNTFLNSQQSVENPSSTNPNTEIVSAQKLEGLHGSAKSLSDLATQIDSGLVQKYGGENGFTEVHLRGVRAFAPSFYFNGLPLSDIFNGNQNLNLIPLSAIGQMNVYPDLAPFWLSSEGIGGDVDLLSCSKDRCFEKLQKESQHQFKLSSTVGSYHYKKFALSHAGNLSKHTQIVESMEYTQSLEDYPVYNNSNSTLNPDKGVYQNLQNNDFTHLAGSISLSHLYKTLGKLNFHFAGGSREQGIPAAVGSISQARLKNTLFIATGTLEKMFPHNGIQWINQIGGFFQKAQSSSAGPASPNSSSRAHSYTLQAKSYVVIPSDLLLKEQTGFALELLNSYAKVETSLPINPAQIASQTVANRLEYRPSLFEGIVYTINENVAISANASLWLSGAQDNVKEECNTSLFNCASVNSALQTHSPIYGSTLSLQSRIYSFIPYLRYTITQRRPYLVELYGSPGGTLPNSELKNEQSKKAELGLNIPFGQIGLFHAEDINLIFLQQASPTTAQYINLQSGYRNGSFMNLEYDLSPYWKIAFNYEYLNAHLLQNEETLIVPRSPNHTLALTTALRNIPLTKVFEQTLLFGSYLTTQYESDFYLDTANMNRIHVPLLYHAGTSFSLFFASHKFLLSMDVFNLTDEKFASLYNAAGCVLQINSNGYLGIPPPGRRLYRYLTGEF